MCRMFIFFCFKQKTAYEMRISDWSSDVCSSDLGIAQAGSALLLGSRGRRFEPCSPDQLVDLRGINSDGRLGEWLKPAVLKTAEPQGSVGSNPTSSSRI